VLLFFFLLPIGLAYSNVGDGRHGSITVTANDTILNNYTRVTAAVSAGASSFILNTCTGFPSGSDIVLHDMSGANVGRWQAFFKVSINSTCGVTLQAGETMNWTTSSKVGVVDCKNYVNMTVTGSVTGKPVNQVTGEGGFICLRVQDTLNTTGFLNMTGRGFAGSPRVNSCGSTSNQGTDYDNAGTSSTTRNGAGASGTKAATSGSCRTDGAGGAGQGSSGSTGTNTGTCTGTVLAAAGITNVSNTSTYAWLEIGGGGSGGAVCNADGDAREGTNGSGVIIVYAQKAVNLRATTNSLTAFSTNNGDGDGGTGGAGSQYYDIYNATFTSVTAKGTSQTSAPSGGDGVIGGHFNITSGTADPTITSFGDFQPGLNTISWGSYLSNVSQSWNTASVQTANATNTSTSCIVQNYTSNTSHIPINLTSGLINLSSNYSKANQSYSVLITAFDNCSTSITQVINYTFTYNSINITSVLILPSPTGTTSNLTCNVTVNNTDNNPYTINYRWYKNSTQQHDLNDSVNVTTGNLTLGDSWICSASTNDTLTISAYQNSTNLTLGDMTAPLINAYSISSSSGTIGVDQITGNVNCTDNQGVSSALYQIIDPNAIGQNLSMVLQPDGTYEKAYTIGGTTGTYQTRAYCIDGSGNTNASTVLTFVASSAPTSSGGSSSSTTVIVQPGSTAAYKFDKALISTITFLNNYEETPRLLKHETKLNKPVNTCTITGNFTCKTMGNSIFIEHIVTDYGFIANTVTGTVTATNLAGESTTSNVEFKIINIAAGTGPVTTWKPPAFFQSFPYLIRVTPQDYFGGIRLVPAVLFLIIMSVAIVRSVQKGRG
jgi:hypothetical protein